MYKYLRYGKQKQIKEGTFKINFKPERSKSIISEMDENAKFNKDFSWYDVD